MDKLFLACIRGFFLCVCVTLFLPGIAGAAPSSPDHGALPSAAPTVEPTLPPLEWATLQQGLELSCLRLPESRARQNDAIFLALRIDPEQHALILAMASEVGQPYSLVDWSDKAGLRAGINAGMYLPDKVTHTGYMRNGTAINNSVMGSRLGAFFVAGPTKQGLAQADIIERDSPKWRERLEAYTAVAQNYRFLSSDGKALWPEQGTAHSIAVVGKDAGGRILFLLSQEPLPVQRFAHYLTLLPLSLESVMYVEGGSQAGVMLRTDGAPLAAGAGACFDGATAHPVAGAVVHVWKGRQSLLQVRGSPDALLPNIIGVRQ